MNFWPDDITADEIQSPHEILSKAADELANRVGKLDVSIGVNQLSDRVVLSFKLQNKDFDRILVLFEVSHRKELSYPAVIFPPTSDIPEFLQRKRLVPGRPGIFDTTRIMTEMVRSQSIYGTPSKYVENEWICATPSEFREKLKALLATDYIKTLVMSLVATDKQLDQPQPLPDESNSIEDDTSEIDRDDELSG